MKQPQIDDSPQGSEEWIQSRLGKFTASKAGDLMLRQKNGKPLAARANYIIDVTLERLTGEAPEFYQSDAMREGTERERTAALAYSFQTGNETEQTGFWHYEYYGASPDDLVIGKKRGVEYKNPKPATHYDTLMKKEIPPYYYWQIIQNLLVTGYDEWDYVSYHPKFPPEAQLFIKTVYRSDAQADIDWLKAELEQAEAEVQLNIETLTNYKEN